MSRNTLSLQNKRSSNTPFDIGTFSRTSLRHLTGTLGPLRQVTADGYGKGEYNHWYKFNITSPAWAILIRSGPRPKYLSLVAYDLNKNPIEGRSIFDADSISLHNSTGKYYPYLSTMMGAQSNLYNTFDSIRLDQGDQRYYPLEPGSYLFCISAQRNERIDYGIGLVIEFSPDALQLALEDDQVSLLTTESSITLANTVEILSPINTNYTIPPGFNAFTQTLAVVNPGFTVTVGEGQEWLIETLSLNEAPTFVFDLEPVNQSYFDTIHDHSLSDWQAFWFRDHQSTDKFPEVFIPYTNRP